MSSKQGVAAGVTLTISPRVVVKFQDDCSASLAVNGALIANGTPTQPISFTSNAAVPEAHG